MKFKVPANLDPGAIAIVGMSGRFPGAATIDAFWKNLCDGVESIRQLGDHELLALGVGQDTLREPGYVKAAALMDGIEEFDARFFGFTPREAELLDPQHRVLLECSWEVLEHAGYDPERYPGSIGVFAGATVSTYLIFNLLSNPGLLGSVDHLQLHLGNAGDFLSTRVSYKLNLTGPSYLIESACSTSLSALHLACQSLLNEECDMALAGGVSINVKQRTGYHYLPGGMQSPDGRCRAFDAGAQGTIFGCGTALVLLKRLEDALADGDTIHAVVKGSAVNNDGSLKVGYMAPSVDGQAAVIAEALASADVAPQSISYIEAHGTGTSMGDPIEIQALSKVFRRATAARQFCAIGSLKTNIGHLEAAAGVSGVIKTALALRERLLPPSLHFETPNPEIDFANSPFYVNTKLQEWPAGPTPRRAGVSSFGFGGTNAHVVLEEAPPLPPADASQPWQLLVLSARSQRALAQAGANLADYLERTPQASLADLAYTLQDGRRAFSHRRVLLCRSNAEALAALRGKLSSGLPERVVERPDPPVALLFPGQGAQAVGMGAGLYQHEPLFRQALDRCAELLQPRLGLDLRALLYPDAERYAAAQLQLPVLAQPALFAVGYALAQLWSTWGVRPSRTEGEGAGRYLYDCLAGRLSLEQALGQAAAQLERGEPAIEPALGAQQPAELTLLLGPSAHLGAALPQSYLRSIADPQERRDDRELLLEALGRLWLAGVTIDWAAVWAHQRRRRLALPTYPFERERFWIAPQASPAKGATGMALEKQEDPSRWLYQPCWQRCLTPDPASQAEAGAWLIFEDPQGLGRALAQRLDDHGLQASLVSSGAGFASLGQQHYSIRPEHPEDYQALLAQLPDVPQQIVFLWGASASSEADTTSPGRDLASLILLARALAQQPASQQVRLVLVGEQLCDLTGSEPLSPVRAALLGAAKVIPQEYPGISCRSIDLVLGDAGQERLALLSTLLLEELVSTAQEQLVAYRGRQRWSQGYQPAAVEPQGARRALRQQGVYVIVGGLDGIGMALAQHLAQRVQSRLVLIDSQPPAGQDDWQAALVAQGAAQAVFIKADMHNTDALRAALGQCEPTFGALHGLIYAGGATWQQALMPLAALDLARANRYLSETTDRLGVIAQFTREHALDFCLVCSSLSSVLGGRGAALYAAASAVTDSLASQLNQSGATPWISVNWDTWRLHEGQQALPGAGLERLAMTPAEGCATFERIVTRLSGQVVVSTAELTTRVLQIAGQTGEAHAAPPGPSKPLHPRPPQQVAFVKPEDELERGLAAIWQQALGFEQIGVHDNFFELGGDSFIALHVIAQIEQQLGHVIAPTSLYEALSIRALAGLIRRERQAQPETLDAVEQGERMNRKRQYQEAQRLRKKGQLS